MITQSTHNNTVRVCIFITTNWISGGNLSTICANNVDGYCEQPMVICYISTTIYTVCCKGHHWDIVKYILCV